ncbi:aminotransferase class III-fold pyridoxal phosphate-dependent enzyme [Streptomyces sp. SCA3-4]|uniref:aminotransferase class III-fold pyridoxal phosphate-dependent enzyme n=1 Tax=Streptomyces sichuanensis TaxID=2871810 RepID=UPI001CE29BC7|nr:aminotransferase class III-fold pyridoxal phosphate-dependent enzyme [Streptomyces sichuanensis]MCA6092527.1 aminotransferase class III-fold pyridoxal phosphate-dependent enzyme [Streptomyces sichuanensis]
MAPTRPPLPPPSAPPPTAPEGPARRQSSRESAARTYARSLPIVPVRARGLTIEGADGRRYLDCLSGAGTLALGHNHPVVLASIRSVLDSGAPLQALDLATPVQDAFADELLATLPRGLADSARIRFCGPSGGDAAEAALALVRAATGREGLLAFSGAGSPEAAGGVPGAVTRLPFPQGYRCPFGVGGEHGERLSARWAETLLDDPGGRAAAPAGLIVEPVQADGGMLPAPDGWLRRMRAVTAAHAVPLVADESSTGVGRTGAFWAVEHSGIVPDVMVLSKAIGGSLPLAVVVHHEDLDPGGPGGAGTFRGNQLAMAAGTATLRYVRENGLAERAALLGARMLDRLRQTAREHACVGDVRGRGLMIGVEFVDPEGDAGAGREGAGRDGVGDDGAGREGDGRTGAGHGGAARHGFGRTAPGRDGVVPLPAAPDVAAAVQRACLRRGLIVGLSGPHSSVVHLLPPLTLTDEQAEAVLERLSDAIATVSRTGHRIPTPRTPKEEGAASPAGNAVTCPPHTA